MLRRSIVSRKICTLISFVILKCYHDKLAWLVKSVFSSAIHVQCNLRSCIPVWHLRSREVYVSVILVKYHFQCNTCGIHCLLLSPCYYHTSVADCTQHSVELLHNLQWLTLPSNFVMHWTHVNTNFSLNLTTLPTGLLPFHD